MGGGIAGALVVSHGRDFADALGRALSASWGLVVAGGLLEVASVAGYVLLLHRVVSGASRLLGWRDSYDIALAGTAVTRLLPTAGLGGAAVTVWALHAHGVRTRELAERLLAFLVLLYAVYLAALVASGAAVALGLVHVPHGRGLGILAAGGGSAITAVLVDQAPQGPRGRHRPARVPRRSRRAPHRNRPRPRRNVLRDLRSDGAEPPDLLAGHRPQLFHFRDRDQRKVDIVIEHRDGSVSAVEVKSAATVHERDFHGLNHLKDKLGNKFKAGALLYAGANVVPFGDRLAAVPLSGLWAP